MAEVLIDCQIRVQHAGRQVWNLQQSYPNHKFGITRLAPGETIESHLAKQQWKTAADFFFAFPVPTFLFAPGAESGLGTSVLTAP